MQKLLFLIVILVIFFSCKAKEEQVETTGTRENFYAMFVIDTTYSANPKNVTVANLASKCYFINKSYDVTDQTTYAWLIRSNTVTGDLIATGKTKDFEYKFNKTGVYYIILQITEGENWKQTDKELTIE